MVFSRWMYGTCLSFLSVSVVCFNLESIYQQKYYLMLFEWALQLSWSPVQDPSIMCYYFKNHKVPRYLSYYMLLNNWSKRYNVISTGHHMGKANKQLPEAWGLRALTFLHYRKYSTQKSFCGDIPLDWDNQQSWFLPHLCVLNVLLLGIRLLLPFSGTISEFLTIGNRFSKLICQA